MLLINWRLSPVVWRLYYPAANNLNPFSKAVFVFCGGRGKIIRAIVWDQNGWFEISKKLECQMSFRWPQNSWEASREVSYEQLLRLLKGEDSLRFFPVLEVSKVG